MKEKISFLMFFLILAFIPLKVEAVSASVEEQMNAVIETARAYLRQGEQLQYDSYRKNLNATPEDATAQNYEYTVCSGFTYQVYKQALGIDIEDTTEELLEYAEKLKDDKSRVLFYYGTSDEIYSKDALGTKENPNYSNFVKKMIEIAQPGDIFVITRTCNVNRIRR